VGDGDCGSTVAAGARRILLTLQTLGYVACADGKHFELTPRILDLGFAYLSSQPLWNLAMPAMETLSEAVQESCSAGVLDGLEVVYVVRVHAHKIMSTNLGVGSRLPAFWTSMGRVLLAGLPHLKAGRIKAIGVTGAKRTTAAPDIPAFNEVVPGFQYQSWFGFVLPAGAARPVVMRLNTELNKILANPETRDRLSSQGVDPEGSTPEQLGKVMADDVVALRKLIKATGLQLN
jgi:hypothetical protein